MKYKLGWIFASLFLICLGATVAASNMEEKIKIKMVSHYMGPAQPYESTILKMSNLYGIEPELIAAIIMTESCEKYSNNTCVWVNPFATSTTLDRGLMQINPAHFDMVKDPSFLYNPEINIRIGAFLFKKAMLARKGRVDLALSAYNCGINCYTYQKSYVTKTMKYYYELKSKQKITYLQM